MELAPLEAFQKYAALGPDFLTWILVHVLQSDLPVPEDNPALKVDLQGPMLFQSEGGEARKISFTGDEAAAAPEVLSALRQGKKLTRAKLVFSVVEDTWAFTLDAETFDLKSMKLPVPAIADLDEYLSMRVQSTVRLYQMLDDLFEVFLRFRLDAEAWFDEGQLRKKLAKG